MANIQEHMGVKNLLAEKMEDLKGLVLIDVRRPDEFTGELGHIEGAKLVTLGPDLEEFLQKADKNLSYLFICRSGARSTNACLYAQDLGYSSVINLAGGMMDWNQKGLPKV